MYSLKGPGLSRAKKSLFQSQHVRPSSHGNSEILHKSVNETLAFSWINSAA